MRLSIIAAVGTNKEIGYQGKLPWHLPSDMAHFKILTIEHPVIMGRKTHESIGKPLPHRDNIILTRDSNYSLPGCLIAHSLESALKLASGSHEAFVTGGAEIFAIALAHTARMYLTQVDYSGPADTFFPKYDTSQWKISSIKTPSKSSKDQYNFRYVTYDRISK